MHDLSALMSRVHIEQQWPVDHIDESSNVQLVEGKESNDSQTPSFKWPSC